MNDFLTFFITIIIILIIINKFYINKGLVRVRSTYDNNEYIVRESQNSLEAANKLAYINEKILLLIDSLDHNNENVIRLKSNYNPKSLSENSKNSKYTSYSLNKGEKISLCLREKKDETIFEDNNTIIFVVIHELAHLMTESVGHTEDFWDNMKYLLKEAEKMSIYRVIDYEKENIEYCGMKIKSTPYDFNKEK